MPTTSELIQNAEAQLVQAQNWINILNLALTQVGVTNVTVSPSFATTATSIANTPITNTTG